MRSSLLLAVKLLASAALLAFIISRVPLAQAWDAARHVPPWTMTLATLLYFTAHGVNALKLQVFLPDLRAGQSLRFTLIALFYGAALPGQLAGDAVKAVRLMRIAAGGDAGRAAAAVALDKVVGLFALLVLTALGLGVDARMMDGMAARIATAAVLIAAAGLAALVVVPLPAWLGRWAQSFQAWREVSLIPAVLLNALGLGLLFNVLSIAVFVVLGHALGLELSIAAWAVVVGLLSLALLLPITVAGIGLRETSLVAMLTALGQDGRAALALSLCLLALTALGALAGLIADVMGRDRV